MSTIPTVRCVVLKNHKNRSAPYRLKHSKSPHFVRIRCTNWQVAMGMHHTLAIDHVKFILSEEGENPDEFDFLSFDYLEGFFIDHLFTSENAINIWNDCEILDIRHLGPEAPPDGDDDESDDADQFPDSKMDELDKDVKKAKGYFTE